MKKKLVFILLAIVIVLALVFSVNNFFSKTMISGKYVNKNFENDFIGYTSHKEDTLIIYENNIFISKYYGKGNYELSYGLDGTYIELNYKDETGNNSFKTSINRQMFFGKLKINLSKDLNQYYLKID